jgi:hypothetical protein
VFVLAPENGAREVLHEDALKLQPGAARDVFERAQNLSEFLVDPKWRRDLGPGDLVAVSASAPNLKRRLLPNGCNYSGYAYFRCALGLTIKIHTSRFLKRKHAERIRNLWMRRIVAPADHLILCTPIHLLHEPKFMIPARGNQR